LATGSLVITPDLRTNWNSSSFACSDLGDLENQEEVYAWLVYQRHFEALPELTRSDLDDLIGDSDYLSVLFCELSLPNFKVFM